MSDITIYHNPRCSKSRQTLQLLEARDLEPTIKLYMDSPPSVDELLSVLDMLNIEPRALMRQKETDYKQHQLDNENLTRKELVEAMVAYPKLIERPIVIVDGKAAIGRPPENVLDIL